MAEARISFCVTCRNRIWQIRQTLAQNLAAMGPADEMALVDYGSTDGFAEWVWSEFHSWIEEEKLVFFEVKNRVSWSSPRAKNLAHRIARRGYAFNLDADNFITPADVSRIRKAASARVPSHQWTGIFGDGSFGRLGMPRRQFFELGGYDETMLPMGGQDFDLFTRIKAAGLPLEQLGAPVKPAIANEIADKVAEVSAGEEDPAGLYKTMNALNVQSSQLRLKLEGPARSTAFASYKGLLNGFPVIIDGFSNVHKWDQGGA